MAKSGYKKSADPNYSQETNKVNLETNVTRIAAIYYLLDAVKKVEPLTNEQAKNEVFPAARLALEQKSGGDWDSSKPDEHGTKTLREFGLISYIDDARSQYKVSPLGNEFLSSYELVKTPQPSGKISIDIKPSQGDEQSLQVLFKVLNESRIVDPKFGRDIHPYRCLLRFLVDPRLGGFIRKNEWAYFVNNSSTLTDDQYETFVKDIRKFRIDTGQVENLKKMGRILSRFVEPGVLVEAGGTGDLTAYELSDSFRSIVESSFSSNTATRRGVGNEEWIERQFVLWCLRHDSVRTGAKITLPVANHYASELRNNLKNPLFSAIGVDNVFCIVDCSRFEVLRSEIVSTSGFSQYDASGYFSRALRLYGMFLSEGVAPMINSYLSAIRTKPFVLLAGISGTGKSRMVRQLARGCCPANSPLKDEQKPGNFEIIPVKPNWHDSTELLGYVTRITEDNKPKYVLTPFVKFLAKAWMNPDVPFFLCLDEMNLAPVEQYFAEYLSAIESRKWVDASDPTKGIKTDVVVKFGAEKSNGTVDPFVEETVKRLLPDYETAEDGTPVKMLGDAMCEAGGIRIPSNLVVMGTVNMDETTCSFSRKVLDRAMTFELNDVADMYDPAKLAAETECEFGTIPATEAEAKLLTGKEAYDSAPGQSVAITTNGTKVGDAILKILEVLNEKEAPAKKDDGSDDGGTMSLLAKTPFKIAYRTRNEIMIYCVERIGKGVVTLPQALDEAISMKILSRIEGDSQYVQKKWLVTLSAAIESELSKLDGYDTTKCTLCKSKLVDMAEQADYGYTSFWTR